MKYLLLSLLTIYTAQAEEITIHPTSIYMIIFFLVLSVIIIYAYFIHKCDKQAKVLKEKTQKIETLETQKIEADKEGLTQKQAVEKEIIELNHTISDLQRQIKEGTKNQIVAKIEALEQKRQNHSFS